MLALNSASTPSKSSIVDLLQKPLLRLLPSVPVGSEDFDDSGVHVLFCHPGPVKFKEKIYSRDQIDEMRMEWAECIQREI
ncbi:hypothetical protein ACS0TY_026775 [Phlomoides rotata]